MNKFFFILFTILGLSIQPALAFDKNDGSIAPLVQSVFNSVVNISSNLKIKEGENTNALGSGWVFDAAKGLIVTNNHVVERSDKIEVYFHNGTKLPAKILGTDPKSDIALLQVVPKPSFPLSQVTISDSDKADIGDKVIAIGNPFGLGGSVSLGIISAKDRSIDSGMYNNYIQTDAAINKGNSGGPLFDMAGHLIGMNTAIFSLQGGSLGIGFAIPSDEISSIVPQLETKGKVTRGYMGVMTQEVTDEMANALGFPDTEGTIITKVFPGSPAAKANLKVGDIIVSANGVKLIGTSTITKVITTTPVGTVIPLVIDREGNNITVQLKVAQLADEDNKMAPKEDEISPEGSQSQDHKDGLVVQGLKLIDANDASRKEFAHQGQASGALIVNFILNSPADKLGLKVGDIIMGVDGTLTHSAKAFEEAIGLEKKSSAILEIENKKGEIFFDVLPLT